MINVLIAGYSGKMGTACTSMVLNHKNLNLVGVIDRHSKVTFLNEIPVYSTVISTIPVFNSPKKALSSVKNADVWIDFTSPDVVFENVKTAIEAGVRPVVGTTGISTEEFEQLADVADQYQLGGLIAPNFAIGAILMMEFSQKAAKYFPNIEIIELHHDEKKDAPSGTAIKTAELISEVRSTVKQGAPEELEQIKGARGADYDGMRIHSIRLPGLVAHQEVQFGGEGEGLIIRHDSYNRSSFMSGVALACEQVMEVNKLYYGLEHLL
ncbi:4-hydroxy-tetrahydrodipicolinate reductase [Vagococcus vulneris]|uniref:4-hydroxy-tetrahydrodipicolinate reductase n=1 Tax=Vagococcus vulneris TaxID=1977869 RepID=A0A429ZZ74_9ENTE|nr:4-hydroxy-tetrahydrodipicolinate reductase [Vagococcus vulneris]RST99319.1 4-hydroxy-tetrahydrodipicolinate reductase [Vagococcus vulneris]